MRDFKLTMKTKALVPLLFLFAVHGSWAGRPLATDDAAVADFGTCQVEAWAERAGHGDAYVVGPACGVWRGVELDGEYDWLHPRDETRAESSVALKVVPESWALNSAVGEWKFGLKLAQGFVQPADRGWLGSGTSGLLLVSLKANDEWTVHANLGAGHDRESGDDAALFNMAVVWTPHERVLLFAEVLTNTRSEIFGGTTKNIGARYWLIPDVLGVDLTAGRESGSGSTVWTAGFGWYGISF
jgi:hypothetical protein